MTANIAIACVPRHDLQISIFTSQKSKSTVQREIDTLAARLRTICFTVRANGSRRWGIGGNRGQIVDEKRTPGGQSSIAA